MIGTAMQRGLAELPSAMQFAVTPAFYKTSWFLVLCIFLITALAYGGYRWRVRQIASRLNLQFKAQLAERTRIAQELHDNLVQGVVSASMQLSVANDQLASDSLAKPLVDRALELLATVIDDGREAVRGLEISKDGDQDLERALSRIPEELDLESAADFRVLVEGPPRPLRPIARDEVYRIGREAVTNAFRHSAATTVEAILQRSSDELRLLVRDNGIGIDADSLRRSPCGHCGLPGMREIAEGLGAKLNVWSGPRGTEVELRVPARSAFETDGGTNTSKWWAELWGGSEPKSHLQKRAW